MHHGAIHKHCHRIHLNLLGAAMQMNKIDGAVFKRPKTYCVPKLNVEWKKKTLCQHFCVNSRQYNLISSVNWCALPSVRGGACRAHEGVNYILLQHIKADLSRSQLKCWLVSEKRQQNPPIVQPHDSRLQTSRVHGPRLLHFPPGPCMASAERAVRWENPAEAEQRAAITYFCSLVRLSNYFMELIIRLVFTATHSKPVIAVKKRLWSLLKQENAIIHTLTAFYITIRQIKMVKCTLVIINVPLCLHAQIINTAGNLAVKLKNQSYTRLRKPSNPGNYPVYMTIQIHKKNCDKATKNLSSSPLFFVKKTIKTGSGKMFPHEWKAAVSNHNEPHSSSVKCSALKPWRNTQRPT